MSGCDVNNCIVIEDSLVGLTATASAGLQCILTLTEWNQFDKINMSKALSVVNHLGDIHYPCEVLHGASCNNGLVTFKYLQDLIHRI